MKAILMTLLIVVALALVAVLAYWQFADDRPPTAANDAADAAAAPGGQAQPGDTEHEHTNRLIDETSPYLLQHAHNPVDWHPWGPEAFEKAKRENKPIFLSVGYSTCHWCHVMAHESFEDEEVAEILNEYFVPIKVDREQRPDIDEQYMLATRLFTRQAGWPNSVWLTPDGRPWYAGTYYPKKEFMNVLINLAQTWLEKPEQVEQQAQQFTEALKKVASRQNAPTDATLSPALIDQAIDYSLSAYDPQHGGFGPAPKFPPHAQLALLIHQQKHAGDLQQLAVITHTLDAMRLGGIRDHIGGGFHRYSTDARWFLPHFEKMLYDNAQLIRNYTGGYALTQHEDYRRVVATTFDWIQREMTHEQGAFYSAIDADSEGVEGKFYLWTYDQIIDALGEEDGKFFADIYAITKEGTYYEESTGEPAPTNIPYLPRPLSEVAEELGTTEADLRDRLEPMKEKLLAVRNDRVHPHLDDKIISGWNGLMIGALARAGRVLENPAYTDAAARAADFILTYMKEDGRLLRTWRKGQAEQPAYLDDYAFLARGLVQLHQTTGDQRWLTDARDLADTAIQYFHDDQGGGFYSTGEGHEELLLRAKELAGGGNMPSGNGVMAQVLIDLAARTGEEKYAQTAADTLHAFRGMMDASPHGSESIILGLAQFYQAKEEGKLPNIQLPSPTTTDDQSGAGADAAVSKPPLFLHAFASQNPARPGSTIQVAVRVRIDGNYHIYANDIGDANLIPTTLTLESTDAATLGDVTYPDPKTITDPVLNQKIATYHDTVTLFAPVTISPSAQGQTTLNLQLKAQACDDRVCLAPEIYTLNIPLQIDPGATDTQKHPQIFASLNTQ